MHIRKVSIQKAQCESVSDVLCCALDFLGLSDLLGVCGGEGEKKDDNNNV